MKVEFLAPAYSEYCEAIDHYECERPGFGGDFADEVARTVQRIVAFP